MIFGTNMAEGEDVSGAAPLGSASGICLDRDSTRSFCGMEESMMPVFGKAL